MKQKKIALACFLFCLSEVFAQEEIFRGNLNVGQPTLIYGVEDKGSFLLFTEDDPKNSFFLINDEQKIIQVFDITSNYERYHQVFQLTSQKNYFNVYSYYLTKIPGKKSALTTYQYAQFAKDGSVKPQLTTLTGIDPYDNYLTSFSRQDVFYLIGYNADKLTVTVNIVKDPKNIERRIFAISDKREFKKFLRPDYFVVPDAEVLSFETFLHKNKIYLYDNVLTFITNDNDNPDNTILITKLNLSDCKQKMADLKLDCITKSKHNSFLYNQDLITISSIKEEFTVSIYSKDNELKGSIKFAKPINDKIINWDRWVNSNSGEQPRLPNSFVEDLPKKINTGEPVVGMYGKDPTNITLLLGVYYRTYNRTDDNKLSVRLSAKANDGMPSNGRLVKGGSGPRNSSSSPYSASTPGVVVIVPLPLYFVPSSARPDVEKRVYCEIPFDLATIALGQSKVPSSVYDRLEKITETWSEDESKESSFSFENKESVFVGYLDKSNKKETLLVLEKYKRTSNE